MATEYSEKEQQEQSTNESKDQTRNDEPVDNPSADGPQQNGNLAHGPAKDEGKLDGSDQDSFIQKANKNIIKPDDSDPDKDDNRDKDLSRKEKLKLMANNPVGGHSATPIASAPPGLTVRITFHKATNLPFADVESLSSDPFLLATLTTNLASRHKEDPPVQFRSPTVHKCTDPEFEAQWVLAHVPLTGFYLKIRMYDEDPLDHDDRLGNVHIRVGNVRTDWPGIKNQAFEVKKRAGSWRAYAVRGCAAMLRSDIKMNGNLWVSIENLGESPGDGGRVYTLGPQYWFQHFSPLLGRLTGIKEPGANDKGPQKSK
jgi:hypothetical protein